MRGVVTEVAVGGTKMMMVIRRWYFRLTRLDVKKVVAEQDQRRALLDERLSKLTKAALNGDEDWFMGIPKKVGGNPNRAEDEDA